MSQEELECQIGANIAETIAKESRRPQLLCFDSDAPASMLFGLPDGWRLETAEPLERLAQTPWRKKGHARLVDCTSFITYVTTHKVPETLLYATVAHNQAASPLKVRAVFNDHQSTHHDGEDSLPGWRDFTATFEPRPSEEWKRWTSNSGKPMSQFDFAQFVEDNMKDIAGGQGMPSGADMLKMALQFELTQDKRIKSAVRIQSGGTNIEYVEDDDAGTVERMQAFDRFDIGIPVFWGGQGYRIEAKLRYRLRDGALRIWYDLVRSDLVVDDAVRDLLQTITTGTDIEVLYGEIES